MKRFIHSCVLFLALGTGLAQEGLKPLNANLSLVYKDLGQPAEKVKSDPLQRTQAGSLFIPFTEDFFYAYKSGIPDPGKWQDSGVFVNTGLARYPPSLGVATFDGVNKFGYPYDPTVLNNTISKPADALTSKPINLMVTATSQTLQPSDSVGLSFYYQTTGYGDTPEANDSLVLDFFSPSQNKWIKRVWYKTRNNGPNLVKGDTAFTRAFVWIDSTKFLQDNFQFRFRNSATTTGNFDHWHLDYIYLDKNRSMLADTVYADLTFGSMPTPLLRDYAAMPWEQYITSEMAAKTQVKIKNNGTSPVNMTYQYRIDTGASTLYTYNGNADILSGFRTAGYSSYAPHANPPINYTFAPMTDSLDYAVKHWVYQSGSSVSDFIGRNDTLVQYQRFRNYYALDDGSAEAGYYVNAPQARMAVKVNVNAPDSFLAVRIYFDPVGAIPPAENLAGFRICAWGPGSNGPSNIMLFRDTIFRQKYFNKDPAYSFAEFRLIRPKLLSPGTYYIGIQQLADVMTIGFDRNTDHRSSFYYDSGSGWTKSDISGAIMIRPVFGRTLPHPVGMDELAADIKAHFLIYPNPASDRLMIRSGTTAPVSYSILNTLGQLLAEGTLRSDTELIDTTPLPEGIYFLVLKTGSRLLQQQKIIIQR